MLSIANAKMYLKLAGINKLAVKFDSAAALVNINFIHRGKNYAHSISFQEIEQAFSDGDSTHVEASKNDFQAGEGR